MQVWTSSTLGSVDQTTFGPHFPRLTGPILRCGWPLYPNVGQPVVHASCICSELVGWKFVSFTYSLFSFGNSFLSPTDLLLD